MNVLSLFDGLSGGRIALERSGLKVDNYYSSEIDKYAIQIANKNYPQDEMSRLGDITKWQDWNIDWSSIDLVTGGFPCQAWSIAGKQLGDKDERGMLFWTMLDIMKKVIEYNPKAKFLIENVRMKKEFEEYITLHTSNALGVAYKHLINSALVSAQNRQRYYWTNIELIEDIKDKGILLKDILEDNASSLRPCELREFKIDSICHHIADATDIKGNESIKRVYADSGKSPTLTTMTGGHREPKVLIVPEATKKGYVEIQPGECVDLTFINSKTRRGRSMREKSNCLTATTYDYNFWNGYSYRKLTPLECERLQTLPDNYTAISETKEFYLYNNLETNKKELLCNANIQDAKEEQQHTSMENFVLSITKDFLDMEQQTIFLRQAIKKTNVVIAIEKLEKKVVEQEGCVIDITKIGLDMEMLYIQIKSELLMAQGDIKKELIVKMSTEKYMKILLEDHSIEMKLFIILILLKLIIELKIYIYVMDKASIHFCIDNLKELQGNLLSVELSHLKMESIKLMSNSQRYKMIGNGWTVDVIAHIFKGIGE